MMSRDMSHPLSRLRRALRTVRGRLSPVPVAYFHNHTSHTPTCLFSWNINYSTVGFASSQNRSNHIQTEYEAVRNVI